MFWWNENTDTSLIELQYSREKLIRSFLLPSASEIRNKFHRSYYQIIRFVLSSQMRAIDVKQVQCVATENCREISMEIPELKFFIPFSMFTY